MPCLANSNKERAAMLRWLLRALALPHPEQLLPSARAQSNTRETQPLLVRVPLQEQFKCPYEEKCRMDPANRRFCKRCRLKRCFEIGMRKEYILTDVEKLQKRIKIESNRCASCVPFLSFRFLSLPRLLLVLTLRSLHPFLLLVLF